MIALTGVPFDLCGRAVGSRLGPSAVGLEGLADGLSALGVPARWDEPICALDAAIPLDLESRLARADQVYGDLADRVEGLCLSGTLPLVVGGDHSISIGSVSGALRVFGEDLVVLWIDAHMDLNTPSSSTTGNVHGMPLAALTRLEPNPTGAGPLNAQWRRWSRDFSESGLRQDAVAWFGLRDVDEGERTNLEKLGGCWTSTMERIDRRGVAEEAKRLSEWLGGRPSPRIWISFDVDSLDPLYAPGTGTAVRGGLTYREGHLLAECLREMIETHEDAQLIGVEAVEVNPLKDHANETARVTKEWLLSLFGKCILPH